MRGKLRSPRNSCLLSAEPLPTLERLPREIVATIAERLSLPDIGRLQRVCKSWLVIFESEQIWRTLLTRRGRDPQFLPALPRRVAALVAFRCRPRYSADSTEPMIIRRNAWRGRINRALLELKLEGRELKFTYAYRSEFTSDYGDTSGDWCKCEGDVAVELQPARDPAAHTPLPGRLLTLRLTATSGARGDFESGYPDDVRASLVGKATVLQLYSTTVLKRVSTEWQEGLVPELVASL